MFRIKVFLMLFCVSWSRLQ